MDWDTKNITQEKQVAHVFVLFIKIPRPELKSYQVRQIIQQLKKEGLL